MTAMEQALAGMWRSREKQKLPYLLVNDVRGYFADAPAELRQVRGQVPECGDGKPVKQGPGILHAKHLGDVATCYRAGRHAGAGL